MLKFFGLLALALAASALPTQRDGQQGGWQQGGQAVEVQTGQGQGQVVQPIGTPGNPLNCYLAQTPSHQIVVTNSDRCPSGYVPNPPAQPQPSPAGTGTQQPFEGAQGAPISCYLANNPTYQVSILAGQQCPIGYILARPIATLHQSESFFTPMQWRNIKQQEFDQAEAAFNQASTEADQARDFYNARLRAKADASTARAKALSALNLARARVTSAARDHHEIVQPVLPSVAVVPAVETQGQSQGQTQGQGQEQQPLQPQQTVVVQQPTQPVVVVQQPTDAQQKPSGDFPQTANQLPPPFGQPINQNQGQGQFGQPQQQGQLGQPAPIQQGQLGQPAPIQQQGQLGQPAPFQQGQFGQPASVPQGQQTIITNLPNPQAQGVQQPQQQQGQQPIQQNQPMEQGMQQTQAMQQQNPRPPAPQQVISIVQTPVAQQPQQPQQNQLQQ